MNKIIATILSMPLLFFAPSGLAQVIIDFQSQPTKQQLIQVAESAIKDKNYSTAFRVSNNAVRLFPDYAIAYSTRAIALSNLGKPADATLDFEQAKKLYLSQLRSTKISAQEKIEAQSGLEKVERQLQLLKP